MSNERWSTASEIKKALPEEKALSYSMSYIKDYIFI